MSGARRRSRILAHAARKRDGNRCQICGDVAPIDYSPYGSPHAHHITPLFENGPDTLENIITLCDLCHGVMHPHLWRSWFPQAFVCDEAQRSKSLLELYQMHDDYNWFCHLDPNARVQVQREIWPAFGIKL